MKTYRPIMTTQASTARQRNTVFIGAKCIRNSDYQNRVDRSKSRNEIEVPILEA
jgi:hypothetical protein